jgi:hypothetical protein
MNSPRVNIVGTTNTGHVEDRACDSPKGTGLSREESVSCQLQAETERSIARGREMASAIDALFDSLMGGKR